MIKRAFDIIFSFLSIVLFFPLLSLIALLVKVTSTGPIFYRGMRSGLNGKQFRIIKFRTMIPDAEHKGGFSTALNDSRITSIGRVLRKYKLDELPQLFNIFLGQMSFVGPRPQVEAYTKLYNSEERRILSVRPGLTDYASIKFINLDLILGDEAVDEKYFKEVEPEKNRLRLKYVDEMSFSVDLKILFQTFAQMFKIKSLWNTVRLEKRT